MRVFKRVVRAQKPDTLTNPAEKSRISDMKKFGALILICVLSAILTCSLISCKQTDPPNDDTGNTTVCEHDFVNTESDLNRPATHTSEGRQYVVCAKCGFSKLEILPKLQYESGDKAPEFVALLSLYEGVPAGMTLKQFSEKYLPAGWTFKKGSDSDVVADAEYEMIFTPSTEGFTPFETTIKIKTRSSE